MEEQKMYLQKDAIENILKNGRSQNVFIDKCNRKYIEKWKIK